MPGKAFDRGRKRLKKRHYDAVREASYPEIELDPELKALWRDVQLHWIKTVPGYRDEVRAEISAKQKRVMTLDKRFGMG